MFISKKKLGHNIKTVNKNRLIIKFNFVNIKNKLDGIQEKES